MDPSRAPRSLPLRLAGGRGAGGESEGAAGAMGKAQKVDIKIITICSLVPGPSHFSMLFLRVTLKSWEGPRTRLAINA